MFPLYRAKHTNTWGGTDTGTGYVGNVTGGNPDFPPFTKGQLYARSLNFKSLAEWRAVHGLLTFPQTHKMHTSTWVGKGTGTDWAPLTLLEAK